MTDTKASVLWDASKETEEIRIKIKSLKEMVLTSPAETRVNGAINHLESARQALARAADNQAIAEFNDRMEARVSIGSEQEIS